MGVSPKESYRHGMGPDQGRGSTCCRRQSWRSESCSRPLEPRWFHHNPKMLDMKLLTSMFALLWLVLFWPDCSLLWPHSFLLEWGCLACAFLHWGCFDITGTRCGEVAWSLRRGFGLFRVGTVTHYGDFLSWSEHNTYHKICFMRWPWTNGSRGWDAVFWIWNVPGCTMYLNTWSSSRGTALEGCGRKWGHLRF